MKIAYISHHKRPNYEYAWFSNMPGFDRVKFIDTDFSAYPKTKKANVEYCKVDYTTNALYNKVFHSTALTVRYHNFEQYLEDVDAIIVLEVFSSLSKQFVEYAKAHGKLVIILVYELIPNHPIYKIYPFSEQKNYCLKHADYFVCVSNAAKTHLEKLGGNSEKMGVIYPGINLSVFKSDKKAIKNPNRMIFVGRLDYHKGIDMVIEAYSQLLKKKKDLELWLIGDGTYRENIEQLCCQYKGVKYFGKIENSRLPEYLNQSSIYILPCRDSYKFGQKMGSEQFGFSLVEAMACGLTVISTDCGAIPEIITENNFISPQNDLKDLVYNCRQAFKKDLNQIGQKNIALASDRYDIVEQGLKFEQFIKEHTNEKH